MSATGHVIAEAIGRLNVDYDAALRQAAGDETLVTLYLPGEWVILARRVCELIVSEVNRMHFATLAKPGMQACAVCGCRGFVVVDDGAGRLVQCAECGMACHV